MSGTPGTDAAVPQAGSQMAFDFPARSALGRADFLVAPCNATAIAWVDRWPDWPNAILALTGPAACGKTHLAHVFATRAGATILDNPDAAALESAAAGEPGAMVVECGSEKRPDGAPDDRETEEALLHLVNVTRERGSTLLLTAREPPSRWTVGLADLHSRLAALPVAKITPPDETLLEMVLVKLFADRQVRVPPAVVHVLAARMERSFAAARALVARLDALALERRRSITPALAREALAVVGDGAVMPPADQPGA